MTDDTLRERLERAVNDWQPIETAPKDGTKVILYEPVPDSDNPYDGIWTGSHFGDHRGWGFGWKPTHWRPLPAPPEDHTDGR